MKVEIEDLLRFLVLELDLEEGEIHADSTADNVENWDSLAHLRVCMAMEAKFAVTIPMERVAELRSVPAIRALLDEL